MANLIILSNYNCCKKKTILYKIEIKYKSLEQKNKTSY